MKKRYFKKKENILKGTGYDSLLEKHLHETVLRDADFHPKEKVDYIIPHKYNPDFVISVNGITYYIESKGRFRDSAEASKYTHIRKHLPDNSELVFIWEKQFTAFPFSKRRKDGTRMTNEEWADKNQFRHWVNGAFDINML